MAASARAVSPADLRVACPLCGGIIHPLAGRCKHCKGDLTQAHQARMSRAAAPPIAPLPALGGAPLAAPAEASAPAGASPWAPGGMASGGTDTPRPLAPFSQVQVPVYGRVGETPRVLEGSGTAAPDEAPRARWVWWVIGAAVLAIIAALVLLVWPTSKPSTARRVGAGGDAMSTSPLPDRSPAGPNPWAAPGPSPGTPDPGAGGSAAPDPDTGGATGSGNDSFDDTLNDILGSLGSLGGGGTGTAPGGGAPGGTGNPMTFLGELADKTCDRLEACGMPSFACGQVRSLVTAMGGAMFGRCTVDDDKAEACLDAVGGLSCDDVAMQNLQGTAMKVGKRCVAAMTCPPGAGPGGFDLDSILQGGGLGGLGGGSTGP